MSIRADYALAASAVAFLLFAGFLLKDDFEAAGLFGFASFLLTIHASVGSVYCAILNGAEMIAGTVPEDDEDDSQDASPEGKE